MELKSTVTGAIITLPLSALNETQTSIRFNGEDNNIFEDQEGDHYIIHQDIVLYVRFSEEEKEKLWFGKNENP